MHNLRHAGSIHHASWPGLLPFKAMLSAVAVLCALPAPAQNAAKYWNATPDDVNGLLKSMKQRADVDYSMQIKSLDEVDPDPEKNPVLFRSGHYNFSYTPEQREKLRAFMLAGGMLIYNTGLGSAPFYRSAKRELAEIFPEQPLQRLSSDHPVFHSYYDVDRVDYCPGVYKAGFKGNEPWFDGIEINCRVVALVSRWGMAVGWEGAVEEDYQAYEPASARRLGVNIFAYAFAMRAWAKNAAHAMTFVDKSGHAADKVTLAQVVYDGVWKTRHAGLSVLLKTFNARTHIPVKFGLREIKLTNARIFDSPLLYLTGHEHFDMKRDEIEQLRLYLDNGGLLFAEACCGRKGFDLAFRKLMRRTLPGHPLRPVPMESPLFRTPNDLRTAGVTPTLAADLGQTTITPRMEAVTLDGHYAVLYSPLGLAGGWEMSQSPYARGYNDVSAIKLGQNILMYAVTQ